MPTTVEPLNSKQVKQITNILSDQYGCNFKFEHHVLLNPKDRKLYLMNDVSMEDLAKLRINSIGLYFGEYNQQFTEIRLSVEGSQIVGKIATKNKLQLSKDDFAAWLNGAELKMEPPEGMSGYVIVTDSIDCASVGRFKEGKLLNFLSKNRRVNQVVAQSMIEE